MAEKDPVPYRVARRWRRGVRGGLAAASHIAVHLSAKAVLYRVRSRIQLYRQLGMRLMSPLTLERSPEWSRRGADKGDIDDMYKTVKASTCT